jgi:hypothetical protein
LQLDDDESLLNPESPPPGFVEDELSEDEQTALDAAWDRIAEEEATTGERLVNDTPLTRGQRG